MYVPEFYFSQCVLPADHGSCAIDTATWISLVFKARRTNVSGSDWQTVKQGHLNRHSGRVLSREAYESEEVIELKRDKEDKAELN